MIAPVLNLVQQEMEEFFHRQLTDNVPEVVLDKLVTRDGKSTVPEEENRVVITLLNAQEERNMQRSRTSELHQPYYLNLWLMFSIHEKEKDRDQGDYLRGLEYLDTVLRFFQQNPVFTPQNSQRLPEGIQHLQFELMNESLKDTSYVWTMTGAKHAPFVLYMVRSLTVGDRLANRVSGVLGGVSVL